MKNRKLFRQGDILIEEVASVPAGAVLQKAGQQITVALGEVTGHHHSLDIDNADWWKTGEDQYIAPKAKAALVHQEHAPIPLKPGKTYRVSRQREYSPEAIRNVAD